MLGKDYHQRTSRAQVTRKSPSISGIKSGFFERITHLFSDMTRFFLVINIAASLILFILIWWGLPQFLSLSQSELVVFMIESSEKEPTVVAGYFGEDSATPFLFKLTGEDAQKSISTIQKNQGNKKQQLSMFMKVMIDDILVFPEAPASFTTDRWQRWQYFFQHLKSFNIPSWRRILLFHISLNKSQTFKEAATLADISDHVSSHPGINKKQAYSCPIAVINSTGQSGLARQLSTMFEQTGMIVVRVSDNDQQLEKSQIVTNKENKDCVTILKKMNIVTYDTQIKEDITLNEQYRSQAVLILGKDLLIQN